VLSSHLYLKAGAASVGICPSTSQAPTTTTVATKSAAAAAAAALRRDGHTAARSHARAVCTTICVLSNTMIIATQRCHDCRGQLVYVYTALQLCTLLLSCVLLLYTADIWRIHSFHSPFCYVHLFDMHTHCAAIDTLDACYHLVLPTIIHEHIHEHSL
jgi:hypothetical protein